MTTTTSFNIDILFFAISLLAFVLVFIPFYWHLKAKNTGTCLFMVWTGFACLVLSINSILWNGKTTNFAPIWCDVSAKFLVGANASIPSISLCINSRLWFTATDRVRTLEKRSMFVGELMLGLGVPVLEMILQFVVQDRRFDIYEGYGCSPASSNVLLTYLLILAPQLLIGIISMTFCIMTFVAYHRLYKHMLHTQPSPIFHRQTTLSVSFLWFLALGGLATVCSMIYTGFVVYLNATATATLNPLTKTFALWQSWDQMHLNITSVSIYTEEEWREHMSTELFLEANRWLFVGLALIFFLFFGFTREAMKRYRALFGTQEKNKWMLDTEVDRGIAHYAINDTESTPGAINRSMSSIHSALTDVFKASIGNPRPLVLPVQDSLSEAQLTLDNPYPVHISGKNDSYSTPDLSTPLSDSLHEDPFDITLPISRVSALSLQLSPHPLLSPTSSTFSREQMFVPVAPNSASIDPVHSQRDSAFSTQSSSSPLPAPRSLRMASRALDITIDAQLAIAPSDFMPNASSPSSLATVRGRSNSLRPNHGSVRRASPRTRSLSRNRSASTTSPPTVPLPDLPLEAPYTPDTNGILPLPPSKSGDNIGPVVTPVLPVPSHIKSSNSRLEYGRSRSQSQRKERHLLVVEYGAAF